jgi:hypothetical protein
MAYYRLYILNGNGRFRECVEFEAKDDKSAILQARPPYENGAELWCDEQRIVQWEARVPRAI